eukprot:3090918-Pleurochrysis_carterae.AAC.1
MPPVNECSSQGCPQNAFARPRCRASTHARDGAAPTSGRRPPCSPQRDTRLVQPASTRDLYW